MSRMTHTFRENLRIIWAITAKDILEAIKNKSILANFMTILFLLVFYKVMPTLWEGDRPPSLVIYDAGNSSVVAQMEEDSQLDPRLVSTQEDLAYRIGGQNTIAMGLIFPADFDTQFETQEQLELNGYVDHWVSDANMAETQSYFEETLAEWMGKTVSIHITNDTIYTRPYGGHAFTGATTFIMLLTMLGLMITPTLMTEERESKTMDALLISPANAGQIVIGKALVGLFYCLLVSAVALIFNITLVIHWWAAILAIFFGALFTVSVGLLLGSLLKVKQQVGIWMFILFQPIGLVAILAQIDFVPENIRNILTVLPTTALGKVIQLAFSAHAPVVEVLPLLAYLAGSGILVLAIVAWIVRRADQ